MRRKGTRGEDHLLGISLQREGVRLKKVLGQESQQGEGAAEKR